MTIPSITGSILQIQTNQANGSQSVSVPADAKLILVGVAYWGVNGQNYATMTLGGEALSAKQTKNNDVSYGFTTIWTRANPLTGTRTFAWTMSRAPDEGANFFLVFLKDVDTAADPIRAGGTGVGASSATSASFASNANDLCLCVGYSYTTTDSNAAPSGYGQTEIADSTQYNNCQGAIGTKPGVAGNTTMRVAGNYCCIAAVSIKGTIDNLNVSPGNADLVFDIVAPGVSLGDIEISPGNADLVFDVVAPGVVFGDIEIYPGNADLGLDVIAPTVQEGGEIPPLGEGVTPGFVFWMLAHSYYQNMSSKGYGEGLEEPSGSNAATWGGIFFTS